MNLIETIKIAFRSLRANKMRSMLTMLGIIIGVASVVTMIAVGSGAQKQVAEQIRSLGSNVLMVMPGTAQQGATKLESGSWQSLTESDARAIDAELPSVKEAAPSVRQVTQIVVGNQNWRTNVNGTTSSYFVIREWSLSSGRYFSGEEEASGAKVVIIGKTVAEQLFGEGAAVVGQSLRIANTPFEIIGLLSEKGPSGAGRDQDDIVFSPLLTARQRLIGGANQVNREAIAYILVKATSDEAMPQAESQISQLLRQRHRLREDEGDDFQVTNPAETMEAQTAATRTISWLLAAVASVSLVVGGISIMNIMLVSVTERTREIGLRMAVGAKRHHIRNQFFVEALTLCLLGGLIGLALGVAAAAMVASLAGWPIFLSPLAMLLALVFAAGVGVFFGYYPAKRAANMDPIRCLRSD
jgi:putative ABC transport system permease protein